MATCKDCFHFEVCDSGRHIGEYIKDQGTYSDGVESECPTFRKVVDVAEVVRCCDCRNLTIHNSPTLYAYCEKTHFRFEPFKTDTRSHFCSYGERRNE